MRELRKEEITIPALLHAREWNEIINLILPKISGHKIEDVVEINIKGAQLTIIRVIE